jgi:glycosyltransferase A (GT-A) superfamily protein (DUF2064 family)
MRQRLVVMVKEPHPGRVKTRLGRDIGMTTAAFWFRHQALGLLRRISDPRWSISLAVSPDFEGLASRIWPAHLPRIPQGRGNLGARMKRQLVNSDVPTLIIGADIPGIRRQDIAHCFHLLAAKDFVFGPAPDGGYWAVGAHRLGRPLPIRLFDHVRWSTEFALSDSLASLGGASYALADMLDDVDTLHDLQRVTRE